MSITGLDLCTDAVRELGVLNAADVLAGDVAAQAINKANRILDNWNADQAAAFADTFLSYTLTPNLNPHTIGPTGTFVATQRPVTIEGANLIFTAPSPDVSVPITLRDRQWWQDLSVPALTSTLPTDLFYDPTWPNGTLNFWPVPTVAYGVELQTRTLLAALTLVGTVSLPPGYQDALTLTLAEDLAGPLTVPLPPLLPGNATRARARIFVVNVTAPRLRTRDDGVPSSGRGMSSFNYLTGAR